MLLLTSPGERVMDPVFGVGIRRYLFEQATTETYEIVSEAISRQVALYLPHVEISSFNIEEPASSLVASGGAIHAFMKISWRIKGTNLADILEINSPQPN